MCSASGCTMLHCCDTSRVWHATAPGAAEAGASGAAVAEVKGMQALCRRRKARTTASMTRWAFCHAVIIWQQHKHLCEQSFYSPAGMGPPFPKRKTGLGNCRLRSAAESHGCDTSHHDSPGASAGGACITPSQQVLAPQPPWRCSSHMLWGRRKEPHASTHRALLLKPVQCL